MRLGEGGVRKDEKVGEGWNVIGWEVGKETEREREMARIDWRNINKMKR